MKNHHFLVPDRIPGLYHDIWHGVSHFIRVAPAGKQVKFTLTSRKLPQAVYVMFFDMHGKSADIVYIYSAHTAIIDPRDLVACEGPDLFAHGFRGFIAV